MTKALYGIVVFDIIIAVFSFFALLANSIILACLSLVGSAISLVPLFMLIQCLDRIDNLEIDLDTLRQKFRAHEKAENGIDPEQESRIFHDAQLPKMESQKRWICKKCQSVNKPGTATCDSCGARYTFDSESPAEAPLTKWKLKDNEKKRIHSQESN